MKLNFMHFIPYSGVISFERTAFTSFLFCFSGALLVLSVKKISTFNSSG